MSIMKAIKYICVAVLAVLMTACNYDVQTDKLYLNEDGVKEFTADGKIYDLNDFYNTFSSEKGNYMSEYSLYRTRATKGDGIYLFSIDTIPSTGPGIYIRGRVSTDDYGGNFYKSMVIQQVMPDGTQQNLRLSIDMGSASGMYPRGQEIIIRCNGLAIGRYANQPQLCVPSYNNNTNAQHSDQKVGWAPGRIPAPICRKNIKLIGTPDESKLQYDTIKIADFIDNYKDITGSRLVDGRLVVIKDVWFNGKYYYQNDKSTPLCNPYTFDASGRDSIGNPEEDTNAAVFGPTTGNVGFPQSRCITDGSLGTDGKEQWTLVSSSEYAKYAHFYLPYEFVGDAMKYGTFKGSVRGILGYYMDNAFYDPDKSKWAITICDMEDLNLYADGTGEVPAGTKWGKYVRPSDGREIDLRKEWVRGVLPHSILIADDEN